MIRITEIIDKVLDYYPEANVDIIDRAYIFSARAHAGQLRLSGEPYLSHPLEVSNILADLKLDPVSIAAGLLHDVVEDTKTDLSEIRAIFGDEVANIVAGVTKISELPFGSKQRRQAESIRKMILAMAKDLRVILIKLADRLHNIKTLHYHKSEVKRKAIARETLEIYAPIAGRLGIYWIKKELEDIAFAHAYPEEYEKIKEYLAQDQIRMERYMESVKTIVQNELEKKGIKARVLGRNKHYYSIYNKMKTQNLSFDELYDIIGFRIILNTVSECYEVVGYIHSLWNPITHRFKDYIALPKPNMYQSLHTTVMGPDAKRLEFQIRTEEMDLVANYGIAAHWSYKEGKIANIENPFTFAWLKDLVDNGKNFSDAEEFLQNVKIDLYPDQVFVFTPKGEVKSLPKGATPVDFAYMIHTELGDQCTGARINNRLVPLNTRLKSGDVVEVITSKGHEPSKDWLQFVVTVKAKNRIRHYIRKKERERSLALGKEICEKNFRKHKLNFHKLIHTPEMEETARGLNFKTVDDMIASIGFGKITPAQVIRKLEGKIKLNVEIKKPSLLEKITGITKARKRKKEKTQGILVHGQKDILIRTAKCCNPIPGDPITGYITQGRGITIHRADCVNVLKISPERKVDVEWEPEDSLPGNFPATLTITGYDAKGELHAEVAAILKKAEAGIIKGTIEKNDENQTVRLLFTVSVKDLEHLEGIMQKLKKLPNIHQVTRD